MMGMGRDMMSTPQMAQVAPHSFPNQVLSEIYLVRKTSEQSDNIPWSNVTIPYRCHGDDGPVQGCGHRDELVGVGVLLNDEGEAGKYQHAHNDYQTKETKFLV